MLVYVYVYARVSTLSQNLEAQISSLTKYAEKNGLTINMFFSEKISTRRDQLELKSLLSILKPDDKIIITELSRLARHLSSLIEIGNQLKNKKVDLISLKENVDTTTSTGMFIFHLFGCFYELERDLISERTKKSLEVRRARGFMGGRPGKDPKLLKKALEDYNSGKLRISEILKIYSLSRATLYRYIKKENAKKNPKK